MAANHKTAHIPNVRERRASRVEDQPEAVAVAQSEAQPSDSAEAEAEGLEYGAEEVSAGPRSAFEAPLTYGDLDK